MVVDGEDRSGGSDNIEKGGGDGGEGTSSDARSVRSESLWIAQSRRWALGSHTSGNTSRWLPLMYMHADSDDEESVTARPKIIIFCMHTLAKITTDTAPDLFDVRFG